MTKCSVGLTRRVVTQLARVNLLSFLAQVVQIGTMPPLIALRLEAMSVSPLTVGIVAAAPWIAILAVGRFVPSLLASCGVVKSNAIAFVLSLCAVVGMSVTDNVSIILLFNLIFGLGLIIRWIACDTWIVAIAPLELRGRAIGTHETIMGCGIAVGPLVIGLSSAIGVVPWMICAGLLVLGVSGLLFLGAADVFPEKRDGFASRSILVTLPLAIMAGWLAGFAETASISFLPVMAEANSFALGSTAVLAGFGIGGTLLQVPIGWFADQFGYRRTQLLMAIIVFANAIIFLLLTQHVYGLWLTLFFWGGAIGGMNTLAVIEAGRRASVADASAVMMAVALAYTIGSIVGPVATGAATWQFPTYGLNVAIMVAAGFYLLLWVLSERKTHALVVVSGVSSSEVKN